MMTEETKSRISELRDSGLCRYCGKRLVFTPGKRKKTFCNKACRSK